MTKHADRKAAARAYAAEHGVSYSEARRALGYDENGTRQQPRIVGPRVRTFAHAPHPVTGEPTPVRVDWFGNVLDQHIWRGRLYSLIGFHHSPEPTYAPQISWGPYLAYSGDEDSMSRGKYPVFAPVPRVYEDPRLAPAPDWGLVALPEPVSTVVAEALPTPDPHRVEAMVTSEEQDAPDLDLGYTFDVQDWLLSLSDEEIRVARADEWNSPVLARFVIDEAHWQTGVAIRKGGPLPVPVVLQAWAEHTDGLMEQNLTHQWLLHEAAQRGEQSTVEARMDRDGTLAYPWDVHLDVEEVEGYLAAWTERMTPDHMLLRYDPTLPGGRPARPAGEGV